MEAPKSVSCRSSHGSSGSFLARGEESRVFYVEATSPLGSRVEVKRAGAQTVLLCFVKKGQSQWFSCDEYFDVVVPAGEELEWRSDDPEASVEFFATRELAPGQSRADFVEARKIRNSSSEPAKPQKYITVEDLVAYGAVEPEEHWREVVAAMDRVDRPLTSQVLAATSAAVWDGKPATGDELGAAEETLRSAEVPTIVGVHQDWWNAVVRPSGPVERPLTQDDFRFAQPLRFSPVSSLEVTMSMHKRQHLADFDRRRETDRKK